ncbi:MAG TPA: nucleotidyltransferase [Terriglobales bacterium]|nr:nucleotidyltransferase [Terriglobales bacterium]
MPVGEPILPISSSMEPQFAPEQKLLFRHVLELLNRHGVPYVVSGAFALHTHTGIWRDTKDLDIFLTAPDADRALRLLRQAGFVCEIKDEVWLAKAHRDDFFVDLITGMSNGVITVDDSWIERGRSEVVLGVPSRVLGAEELIASKMFVTRRERFDGADIAHVVYGTRGDLDWGRLVELAGEHWEVLLWNLLLFRYCYPMATGHVPAAVWRDLLGRLHNELDRPQPNAEFRGSLIDDKMFAIDVAEWGLPDVEKRYRDARNPKLGQSQAAEAATGEEDAA